MKRIELITTQQVRISYEIAGLGDRILAFFVDICVLGGLMFAEAFTLGILGANDDWIYLLVILSTFIFYTLISEILMGGQTLGKKALGLKVIQVHGRHPQILDFIIRWAFRLLDIHLTAGSLAAMTITSGELGQRLGDRLSNTVVVRLRPKQGLMLKQLMEIEQLENYAPRFPQVRQLEESEMLTLKACLDRYQRYRNPAHAETLSLAATKVKQLIGVEQGEMKTLEFVRTLIQDYVVLTR